MTKNKYYFPISRFLGTLAIIGLAALASSCGPTTATYTTPDWATGISDGTAPYYYFPDYGMYYDATAQQYYYPSNGAWVSSAVVPYQGVNLNDAYVVELNRGTQRPWENHDYYARNYPPHEREQYEQVVRSHNIIPNVPQNHVIVPRAYDENTNRMTFEEREARPAQPGARVQSQQRIAVHQVPMQTIAPNMPAQARGYRWGGAAKGR
jgi:hypothetical protein